MPSKSEVANADYESKPLRDTAFGPGEDEGTSVNAGRTAEVAVLEVGASNGTEDPETGALSEYIGWIAGDVSDKELRSGRGKTFINGSNGVPEDLPKDVEYRLVVRRRRERGGKPLTNWLGQGEVYDPDQKGEYPIDPSPPFAMEGQVIALQARREGGSFTFSLADSSFKLPGRAGQ